MANSDAFRFEIAFSFAGQHRDKVRAIAELVSQAIDPGLGDRGKGHVFFDEWFEHEILGADMDVLLQRVYQQRSLMVVTDLSDDYADRRWPQAEARAIRALRMEIDSARDETARLRVIAMRFADGDVPGVLPNEGWYEARGKSAEECAGFLLKRYQLLRERLGDQAASPPALVPPKSSFVRSAANFDISRIIKYAPAELIGREEELKLLNDAWAKVQSGDTKRPRVLTFVALGGEGKTSLVAKWAAELAGLDWPGCEGAFAWSFYSQGTREQAAASSDLFLKEALDFFGDEKDKEFAGSSAGAYEKGQRLARIVGQRCCLLILDGLEPLQYAPSSPMPGQLKDQGLAALLKSLATMSRGLCVVTTRYTIPDLKTFWRTTAPERNLLRLSIEAGVHLLKTLGVGGRKEEFEKLVEDVKGHALTLNLLGTFLRDAHAGDIRRRDLVKLEEADAEEQGGHAFRVMDAYVKAFEGDGEKGQRALAMLRLMGLFDRPATADCLGALWSAPAIAGLTESQVEMEEPQRNIVLKRLEDAKLLTVSRDPAGQLISLDAHPLLREYLARALRDQQPEAWNAAHWRLCEYLSTSTPDKPQPTLEDLEPLFQAIAHGCLAGLYQETFDKIYIARISRGKRMYAVKELGLVSSDLAAISCFFEQAWSRVFPALRAFDRVWLFSQVALCLRALGRLTEALAPAQAALNYQIQQQDWGNAASSASNLSDIELGLGYVSNAVAEAAKCVIFSDKSGDVRQRLTKRSRHADALHQAGRNDEAAALFDKAESLQVELSPDYKLLHSVQGFQYCDLLLANSERDSWTKVLESYPRRRRRSIPSSLDPRSSTPELRIDYRLSESLNAVSQRATQTLAWVTAQNWLLDIALDHLTLERIFLYRTILECRQPADFKSRIELTLEELRRASFQDYILRGLLTRGWQKFYAVCTGDDSAQSDLNEAWDIASRGPMRLHMADIHLYRARLFFREKDYPWADWDLWQTDKSGPARPRTAADDLAAAEKLINECGYHRRDEELADAKRAILGSA